MSFLDKLAMNRIIKSLGNGNDGIKSLIRIFGVQLLKRLIPWLRKKAASTKTSWDDKAVDMLEKALVLFDGTATVDLEEGE